MARKNEVETKLTQADRKALAKHEETIHSGLTSFIEVGHALAEIRESRLYREDYKSFEAYCQDRWDIGRRSANLKIEAAEVVDELRSGKNFSHFPQIESHAFELVKAGNNAAKVWAAVVKKAPKLEDGTPCTTAKEIAAVREAMLKPKPSATPPAAPANSTMIQSSAPPVNSDVSDEETEEEQSSTAETKPAESTSDNPFPAEAKRMDAAAARLSQLAGDIHRVAEEIGTFTGDGFKSLVNKDNIDIALSNIVENLRVHAHTLRSSAPAGMCLDCQGRGCQFCGNRRFQTVSERKDAEARKTARGKVARAGAVA